MARRGRTCVAEGCARRAEAGSVVCADHRWTALGAETEREVAQVTRRVEAMARVEEAEQRRAAAARFRTQLDEGTYAALQPAELLAMLDEAGGGNDLTREIGMLRVAMLRVLREEEHPSRMAHALAKLSFAVGRTMTLQEGWNGGDASDRRLADVFNEILAEWGEKEEDERRPWAVDPYHPKEWMIQEVQAAGVRPGTVAGAMWIEAWQGRQIRELAAAGNEEARWRMERGLVDGDRVLESGE